MSAATPPAPGWRQRMDTPVARLLTLGLLLLMLMIPAGMIQGVVAERQERRSEAQADIESKWGGAQAVIGPVLRVPYATRSYSTDDKGKTNEYFTYDVAYFLPKRLAIHGKANTEVRKRGIFEVPVYTTQLNLEGAFEPADFSGWGNVRADDIDWSRAELILSVSEPRALEAESSLSWNGEPVDLEPSAGEAGAWSPAGIHAALGKQAQILRSQNASFSIALKLRGAGAISFAPASEQTSASFTANWPHPSFQGGWLPAERVIEGENFSARWSVSYLGRNYPQRWRDSASFSKVLGESLFGVSLANPVDNYSMADRITKYALMTMVLTFAVIWLTELLSGSRAHVIQYGFVGAALCLFGLLQLSFAEHFGFALAYAVAAAALILMVTLYSKSVLKRWSRALVVGLVQAGVYAYLYMILQAEDYALLGGSLVLFASLAVVMYLTRKLDWSGAEPRPA